ncbi:MAG: metal-dependent transcriptional regulator [Chloroflexi bacterium]|nr:MAG: transcriptional regulator [Phototrophicales bacterium]RMF78900.1 MAG: metal-dependent transcriptional regulator [Chloroflexota bacterium]
MPEKTPDSRSIAVENFIKAVYMLQQNNDRVSTNALADALTLTAPSVTDMAQRLHNENLVEYRRYHGVILTEDGERLALQILRRHRLIELYLVEELGYSLHEVHHEAEDLEHVVSDRFVEAIAAKLGDPVVDPHGDPIPATDGSMTRRELYPLSDLPLNIPARVSRFRSHDDAMLQYILDRGFQLETQVEVLSRDPFDGPLTVIVGETKCVIGHNVAATILVETLE